MLNKFYVIALFLAACQAAPVEDVGDITPEELEAFMKDNDWTNSDNEDNFPQFHAYPQIPDFPQMPALQAIPDFQLKPFDIPTEPSWLKNLTFYDPDWLKNISDQIGPVQFPGTSDNHETEYASSYSYGTHLVFIGAGGFLFFLSVCLRALLCYFCSRKVVHRVRTITIIRGTLVTPTSDETENVAANPAPLPEDDLPPSYADIEKDLLPPPAYSENYDVNVDSSAPEPISDTDALTANFMTMNDRPTTQETHGTPGSSSAELNRAARFPPTNIRSQFAFKKFENEE